MPRKRKQLRHVISASTAAGRPIHGATFPEGDTSTENLGPTTLSAAGRPSAGHKSSSSRHTIYDTFDDEKRMI